MSKSKQAKEMEQWELEDKASIVMQAEEIKADDQLMKKVKPIIKQKVQAAETVKNSIFPYGR